MSNPRRQKKSEKQEWPFVRFSERENAWLVDARTKEGGSRKFFKRRKDADTYASQCRIQRSNQGTSIFGNAELAAYGWTVQRAIEFSLDHLKQQAHSVPVCDAIKALVESKKAAAKIGEIGQIRVADIENRLARFEKACDGKTMAEITADDITAFLSTIPHPATRNDYRKEIVMLWQFAFLKKWVRAVWHKKELPRAREPEKGRIILTVDQAARLMEASHDDDVCALNALVMFGGIRREEAERLDWRAVDFGAGHIEISADISKVSRERFAPMSDNLRAWLLPLAKKSGPIIERNLMHPLRRTWKRAKLHPWPQDAHRHSFISYRRTMVGDAQTAMEAGTSETIIKKHYKRPVTKVDAGRFFSITPSGDASAKILEMKRASA